MLSEKFNPKIDQEKRKKTFSKLNLEEVNVYLFECIDHTSI